MAKAEDRKSDGYYTIKDILKEAKRRFKIKDSYDDGGIEQYIRRTIPEVEQPTIFIEDEPIAFESLLDEDKKRYSKKPHYYTHNAVEIVLDKMYDYLYGKKGEEDSIDKPSHEIIKENVDQLEKQEELLQKRLSKVGLSRDDYHTLMLDRASNANNYVTLDEMEFLGLTGLVERSDLTEEDTALLECFYQSQQSDRLKEERIKQLYQRKKLEIMITALFNEKFELDAAKLHEDITNYVQQGENVFGITTFNAETGEYEYLNPFSDDIGKRQLEGSLDLSGRKSYLRLQDSRFYYTKKKEEKKKSK